MKVKGFKETRQGFKGLHQNQKGLILSIKAQHLQLTAHFEYNVKVQHMKLVMEICKLVYSELPCMNPI